MQERRYAHRMGNMRASDIRELLKMSTNPGVISLAGGLPAPELFPTQDIADASCKVLHEMGQVALQYTTTEGYAPLRDKIAARMNRLFGTSASADNVLIVSGSQQGLDFAGKLLLDDDDVVVCECPTYVGAISAFRAYLPRFVEAPTDDNGLIPEDLEQILAREPRVKMIYVIPDFQNPSGRCWSLERRKAFMEIVSRYNVVVLEDNPYGELRYEGENLPSLKSMDKNGQVVMFGTFSKILAPGMRIAWILAEKDLIEKFVLIKQGADLQTSTISQMEINAYLEENDIDVHVEKIKKLYRERRDYMVQSIRRHFPPEVTMTYPTGGLFLWCALPESCNARELLKIALEKKVAFVPGGGFFPNGGHENTMRLNFSNMPEARIEEGISRLGAAIKAFL